MKGERLWRKWSALLECLLEEEVLLDEMNCVGVARLFVVIRSSVAVVLQQSEEQ